MKPSDVFGICVRLIGLVGLLLAGAYLISVVTCLMGVFPDYGAAQAGSYGLWGLAIGTVSAWMLRGAPGMMEFAYPPTQADEEFANSRTSGDP